MKYLAIATMITMALASPLAPRQLPVCGGTTGNAQCCATDVLGLVDLNCENRTSAFVTFLFGCN